MTPHAPTAATTSSTRAAALGRRTAGVLAAAALALPLTATPVAAAALPLPAPQPPAPSQPGQQPAPQEPQQQPREEQPPPPPEKTLAERVMEEAPKHEGKPYRYGATGPDAFDCSGYVQAVFRAAGRELPRTSRDQYAASTRVAKADRRPGDLIAVQDRRGRVTHVGIYAGDDSWWVASTGRKRVLLQRLYTERYAVGRFS
ncbi:MAG TPA: NlpC/P60 family protein [Mycobacteriales bacterium]|nr:NlpC/P60 family protein [Mycobacteriales bacterium]